MSRMMSSSTSFFFFLPSPEDGKTRHDFSLLLNGGSDSNEPQIKPLLTNSNYNKHRKENLLEHGLEHWRTRRKQRRRSNGWGENGSHYKFGGSYRKQSIFNHLWISFMCFLMVCTVTTSASQLDVQAQNRRVSGPIGSNVSLTCVSSVKPVLCLWKTPYGHVYTLSEGVFAESGRIRHKKIPQGSKHDKQCGIEIIGVEDRDAGQWECEVGAVTGEDFKTSTANIKLEIKVKAPPPTSASSSSKSSKHFEPGEVTSRQEVGNDVILHCSANREVHLCRWKTPYLNTYIVGEGIYVERGRIQWLGSDPNYDCTIRVANLDLRDSGTWVCEIGSSTKESFQVQTKEFVIDIEKPLKLSAPTSLMQNANTDATLVCHANKPFDDCLWTTPYGKTYSFKPNKPSVSHENGRLAYFGFADTDCGVIVHNVQARDNGGWLCQLHSHGGGGIFQNATDIVPLFADSAATRLGAAQPRSISDYDYDKSISLGGPRSKDKDEDYEDETDFSGRVGTPAIDTFDYDNIDFDDVNKDIRKTTATDFDNVPFTPTKKPKVVGQIRIDRVRPGSDQGAFTKIVGTPQSPTTSKQSRFRPATQTSTPSSIRDSTLRDIFITSDGLPMLELSKIAPTSSSAERTTTSFGRTTSAAHPLSVFGRKPTKSSNKDLRLTGVDPLELELLSRISGTHRDTRPISLNSQERTEKEMLEDAKFEPSKTSRNQQGQSRDKTPEEPRKRMKVTNANSGFTFATEKNQLKTTTPSSETREEMRLREIQRIRDERRRKAMERQKEAKANIRRLEQKRKESSQRGDQGNLFTKESEIARQKEKKRKEEIARRAEAARRKEAKKREELARKAEKEREAEAERREAERLEEIARREEKRRKEEKARQDAIARRKEKERREEAARKEAKRRREEIARQKELRRQKELEKQAEIARKKEQERIEEEKRKEELKRKKEKERQEEIARQERLEEEQKQKEAEELARLAELIRQEEIAEKRRLEEAARRQAEKEEKRRKEIKAKEEEERKRKAEEERIRKLEEDERKRKLEIERRRKAEEERLRRLEEEDRRRKLEAEKKRKAEEERIRRIEEEERKKKLEAERRRKEEEERLKRLEEEDRKRKIEAERKRKQDERRKLEEKRRKEAERKRKEEARRLREEKEKKEKEERERLEEERLKKIREEEEKKKLEEERKRKEEELQQRLERDRKRKEDAARRRAEVERRRQEAREKRRKEAERRKKEEEDRLKKEVELKRKEEEEKARREAEKRAKEERDRKAEENRRRKELQEKRLKEKEENERLAAEKREEERQRRVKARRDREERERRRKEEAEKQRKIEEERQRILDAQQEKERLKKEQEEQQLKRREEDRQRALSRIREERLKLLQAKQEAEKVNRELEKQVEQERNEFEAKRKALEAEREKRIQEEIRQKAELEKQRRREELERRRQEKEPPIEINRASLIPRTESPRAILQSLPTTDVGDTKCYISPTPTNGNITCNGDLTVDGQYIVSSGKSCILRCRQGFVSLGSREARCMTSGRLIGRWSQRLECVTPDAMIIIGGRNTNGVLSSVELVTGRGVCRGAVPPLPAMRWKMIANTIDEDRVLACGGTNIFGQPKRDCWILGFRGRTPFWNPGPDMLTARDSAAWAVEGDYLFVMGGSLGKLKGSTDSVEMFQVSTGRWVEGPSMSSHRHGHCAVGLGNGSLVVTGGYGGLEVAERFDLATGLWTPLPELSPVRAQHGCALVELHGEQGIMVVGGDSGGTRLRDVRFLPLDGPSQEWRKVADLQSARWGRPGVAIVGGRINVAGGWDGVKDLDTVEYYDEATDSWKKTASRLQTERRWLASSPISIRLFPKCAQRRE